MVDIQSKEVIDKISEDLKVQPALQIPRELAKQIQLIYSVNPERIVKFTHVSVSDSTGGAILMTNATKNTYLVGLQLSTTKDVVATSIFTSITGTPRDGVVKNLFTLRYEPLTAISNISEAINFAQPILLEKGTSVTLTHTTAVGSIDSTATAYFFETDPQ